MHTNFIMHTLGLRTLKCHVSLGVQTSSLHIRKDLLVKPRTSSGSGLHKFEQNSRACCLGTWLLELQQDSLPQSSAQGFPALRWAAPAGRHLTSSQERVAEGAERERERETERQRDRKRERERDRERQRAREREREPERQKERERERDRQKERERERDIYIYI